MPRWRSRRPKASGSWSSSATTGVGAAQGGVVRLHQEDFCQALGIAPEHKYQSEGGPSLRRCFELLDVCIRPALERLELLRRVFFNYLIGNADAHGKNFALLHGADGIRLAPAYDLVCTTVYRDHTDRMAMKIGGGSRFAKILPGHWESFARHCGFAVTRVRDDFRSMAERLPVEAGELLSELRSSAPGTEAMVLEQIVADLEARAASS